VVAHCYGLQSVLLASVLLDTIALEGEAHERAMTLLYLSSVDLATI